MDERTRKLISVGASVGANCHPCLEYHVGQALAAGIDGDELMEAVDIAKAVRKGAASSMDKLAAKLIRGSSLPNLAAGDACGCCS